MIDGALTVLRVLVAGMGVFWVAYWVAAFALTPRDRGCDCGTCAAPGGLDRRAAEGPRMEDLGALEEYEWPEFLACSLWRRRCACGRYGVPVGVHGPVPVLDWDAEHRPMRCQPARERV